MLNIDDVLKLLLERHGSDVHFKAGRPPLFRIGGKIVPTELESLTAEDTKQLAYSIMTSHQIELFEQQRALDFSYNFGRLARFRVNVFQQRGVVGMVMRAVPWKIPTIEQLKLPPVLKDIASKTQGLVLVTGPTGSGKSTTLAAMIDYINATRQAHVITIEDPIEFVYQDKKCVINQREIGLDTDSFATALRYVLRQDPDVILIGEMRDLETIRTAVTAAETGHLVFSTLHTNDATQTVDRIIDSFPAEQQQQVRVQLSMCLLAVISQRLVRLANGNGRIAAVEVMINSPTIKKYIEEGNTGAIHKAIEQSVTYYRMQTLNQSLVALAKRGYVTYEDALAASPDPDEFKRNFRGIYSGSSLDAQAAYYQQAQEE
ncbi:MAG TPA: type IV pilus twitching motility protein PilT [Armatimonadetes bacterium]|nr:type IV pilus twitching motility protein PilT [Armatimonadota bacterium]